MSFVEELLRLIAEACLAGAVIGSIYLAVACISVLRFGRKRVATAAPVPVTILVPLCGHEPGLYGRLRALCEQAYAAPVQILCALQDAGDPALAEVKKLAADLPKANIEWHVDSRLHGRNMKMSNLANAIGRVRHDVLVMIDSDIVVPPDHLARVVGELQEPNVGAVTCPYYGIAEGNHWTKLSAMSNNLQFLPSAIVALATRLGRPCFGSTIAMRRELLERIGGLHRFADHLWDDYAIGQAVRETGLQVAMSSLAVGHVCTESTAREFFDYQWRNAITTGGIDPIGHVGSVIIHPFALAVLAGVLGAGDQAAVLALVALAGRMALADCMRHRFGIASTLWLVPINDLFSFGVYITSFLGGTVIWRGQRYRVRSDGKLLPVSQ